MESRTRIDLYVDHLMFPSIIVYTVFTLCTFGCTIPVILDSRVRRNESGNRCCFFHIHNSIWIQWNIQNYQFTVSFEFLLSKNFAFMELHPIVCWATCTYLRPLFEMVYIIITTQCGRAYFVKLTLQCFAINFHDWFLIDLNWFCLKLSIFSNLLYFLLHLLVYAFWDSG